MPLTDVFYGFFFALTTINILYSRGLGHALQKGLLHKRGWGVVAPPPHSREVVHPAGVSMPSGGSATRKEVDQLDRSPTLPTDWITSF